jgi:hypothetical protein
MTYGGSHGLPVSEIERLRFGIGHRTESHAGCFRLLPPQGFGSHLRG